MRFCSVVVLSILLLGGVAFAGGDGERCGGKCGGCRPAVVEETAGAPGDEGEAGEAGRRGVVIVKETTPDGETVKKSDAQPDGETVKKTVRVQLGGDWESLPPEAKKKILETLRGTVDEATLKKVLEGLVKGEGEIEIEGESMGPVRVLKGFQATPLKMDGRVFLPRDVKKCEGCQDKDEPCEKCRKKAGTFYFEGFEGGESELEMLPEEIRKQIRVFMTPEGGGFGRLLGPGGARVYRAVPAGPGAGCPQCGCGGRGQGGMRQGPRGPGMGMRRGPGPRGMGLAPVPGHDAMGAALLKVLKGLTVEIQALRREMRAGHGPASKPAPFYGAVKGGAGGVVILPRPKAGEAPKGPGGPSIGRVPGAIRLGPGPQKADDLKDEVEGLKSELKDLKAQMARLLNRLEKMKADEK